MSFSKQLETLLDICRVSNATLARGLGVDASLVSRWKTGNRLPPEARRVACDIAVFLSEAPLRSREKAALDEILGESARDGMSTAIERFLLGIPYLPSEDIPKDETDALLNGLCAFLQRDGAAVMRDSINLWPRVQRGQPLEHEAFFGDAGRRQAAINMLYTALSSNRPTELYLLMPEDFEWITGDPAFQEVFIHALYVFTQRGGVVNMIQNRLRDPRELLTVISLFWPLYLTGRFISYNLLGEGKPPAPALFIVRGMCSMLTQGVGTNDEVTVFFRHAIDAARHEQRFFDYLSQSCPMAQACDITDSFSIPSALYEIEREPGDCFVATRVLNPLWAPDHMEIAGQTPAALSLLTRRREAFFSRMSQWIELWPEELVRCIEKTGGAPFGAGLINGRSEYRLTGESLHLYLTSLISLLRTYEHFQVILTDSMLNVEYLMYKRHVGALMIPKTTGASKALLLRGDDSLSLLDSWFAPRVLSRDRRLLIARLEGLLRSMTVDRETA